jgi:predicted phosphodiesterase
MRFIGDVHGKHKKYLQLIEEVDCSIQVGDMGVGFIKIPVIDPKHRFIRGNHDNPNTCKRHPNWIKDGSFEDEMNIFCLGGAWSIDWEYRQNYEKATGKKIWWPNEECSVPQLQKIIDYYEECKPEIMVSHDCPLIMAKELNSSHSWDKSKTRQALNVMFEIHKPDVWIFGHHHINMTRDIKGTRFIALDELSCVDMEDVRIDEYEDQDLLDIESQLE